jgi:hypothetical protein
MPSSFTWAAKFSCRTLRLSLGVLDGRRRSFPPESCGDANFNYLRRTVAGNA